MNVTKREFIINELFVENFMEEESNVICLEETEDSGRSILEFQLESDENLSIKNVDCKNTLMHFFQNKKRKFRASYLFAQGIAAMLEMNIVDTCMYTTYENVFLSLPETMPSARRLPLGEKLIKPQDEWNGNDFGLNFGTRIKFVHKPIQMKRNEQDVLIGKCVCGV